MSDTPNTPSRQDAQQAEGFPGDAERRQAERRTVVDRRTDPDRRRGPGLRSSVDRRSAEEGEMTEEQFEFLMAINEY